MIKIKMEHHTNLKMKNCKAENRLDLFMLLFSKLIIYLRGSSMILRLLLK